MQANVQHETSEIECLFADALAFQGKGSLHDAERAYRRILEINPCHANSVNNLAVLLHESGRSEDALLQFGYLAELEPDAPRAWCGRGVVLRVLGRLLEAEQAYRTAVAIDEAYRPAYSNLGNLLYALSRYSEAACCFQQALSLFPEDIEARFMLGKSLLECHEHDLAEAHLNHVLMQHSGHADAWGTLGRLWSERHCMPEALWHFDKGLAVRPEYAGLRYNRSLVRLLAGDLPGGFLDYESRFEVPDFPAKRLQTDKPLWQGEAMPSATLLLYAEQGLGDTLQFLRYLPLVAEKFYRVVLLIPPTLHGLVSLPANTALLLEGQALPRHDVACALLSLPRLLGTDICTIPLTIPYLQNDLAKAEYWAQKVTGEGLRVGIVWAGNPAHKNDANRSLPFQELAPLWSLSGISWYALQVGERRKDLDGDPHSPVLDLGLELHDFADTAGVLQHLDLLICVDTSIAHLAGALGLPVWILLPWMPDWRWQLQRTDSPWYPSARLIRQREAGKWSTVISEVRCELAKHIQPETHAGQLIGRQANERIEAGRQLLEKQQLKPAETLFWRALSLQPGAGRIANALAVVFYRQNRPEAAASFGLRACRHEAQNPEVWSNCAAYLKSCGLLDQALTILAQGMALHPAYPGLVYNRGLARLLAGDLAGGFSDYEIRFEVPDFPSKRLASSKPLWRGEMLPAGTLLLHAEQGLGDTLQALRYLPLVAQRAARVLLLVQPSVAPVVVLPANVEMLADGQPLPAFDVVCPMLSLPHLFSTTLKSIPGQVPYLRSDVLRAACWRSRMAGTGWRVGLVWAGNPAHKNDANRSLSLAELAPLCHVPGVSWYSLQVGERRQDLAAFPNLPIVDLGAELQDFSDTAAVLLNLDLLICVDTSIAHLAGGLGLPVWLMLPRIPDWRWLLQCDHSPWYPSLRLFRQEQAGNWSAVLAGIADELVTLTQNRAAGSVTQQGQMNALLESGRLHLENGEIEEAESCFCQALRTNPLAGRAANALAVTMYRRKRLDVAMLYGMRACRQEPGNAEAWTNFGAYLKQAKHFQLAFEAQQHAMRLDPGSMGVRSNMANLLGAMDRWTDALEMARSLSSEAPENAEIQFNLGIALKENALFAEALQAFDKARGLAGEHVRAHLHMALIELLLGDYAQGWKDYESRWLQPDCKEIRRFSQPQWRGESLAGKRILLHAEQGFGDTLQFLRFVPQLAAEAAQVLLVVQPELETIAARMDDAVVLIRSGELLPPFDYHCPLLSLPGAIGAEWESTPASIPYLSISVSHSEYWRRLLPARKPYRVGLVWAGRPTHGNDANRSMSLDLLSPLITSLDVQWIALQKGPALLQLQDSPLSDYVFAPGDALTSFEDTAAILGEIDELVSVDTSVAHLAGALGKPIRLLLPWIPDWRWLWQRNDSPWYPSMQLYRQPARGDWMPVLAQLRDDLAKAAQAAGKRT